MQWPSVCYLLQNFTQFFRVITLKGREYKTNWPWHLVLGVFESKKMWAAIWNFEHSSHAILLMLTRPNSIFWAYDWLVLMVNGFKTLNTDIWNSTLTCYVSYCLYSGLIIHQYFAYFSRCLNFMSTANHKISQNYHSSART